MQMGEVLDRCDSVVLEVQKLQLGHHAQLRAFSQTAPGHTFVTIIPAVLTSEPVQARASRLLRPSRHKPSGLPGRSLVC